LGRGASGRGGNLNGNWQRTVEKWAIIKEGFPGRKINLVDISEANSLAAILDGFHASFF